ncbi:hypothetical protein GCM10009104_12970 [Marinobacterium maritimum]|uniref:Uncharacterized protein n=1 Tax=Marinobacterium maritimum TaxID=500162 RepID=A0ABN1I4I1_9GAMM
MHMSDQDGIKLQRRQPGAQQLVLGRFPAVDQHPCPPPLRLNGGGTDIALTGRGTGGGAEESDLHVNGVYVLSGQRSNGVMPPLESRPTSFFLYGTP